MATCSDDATVRVWRMDMSQSQSEELRLSQYTSVELETCQLSEGIHNPNLSPSHIIPPSLAEPKLTSVDHFFTSSPASTSSSDLLLSSSPTGTTFPSPSSTSQTGLSRSTGQPRAPRTLSYYFVPRKPVQSSSTDGLSPSSMDKENRAP